MEMKGMAEKERRKKIERERRKKVIKEERENEYIYIYFWAKMQN